MSTKFLLFFIFTQLFFIPYISIQPQSLKSSKDIIGLWQENDSLLTAGLENTYRFYKNNSFTFEVSSYNHLSKLISLSGTFRIKDNVLYLTIVEIKEKKGGEIIMGDENDDDTWTYKNFGISIIKYKIPKQFPLFLEYLSINSQNKLCVKLNSIPYYRLSKDPDFGK